MPARPPHRSARRGQLYAFDLLIAAAVLTAALGFTLQFLTLTNNQLSALGPTHPATAQSLAALLAEGRSAAIALPASSYCVTTLTQTGGVINDTCGSFSTSSCASVYAARRLASCNGTACMLVVKTCQP